MATPLSLSYLTSIEVFLNIQKLFRAGPYLLINILCTTANRPFGIIT